jgi:hypothetical protein
VPLNPEERDLEGASAKSQGKLALVLGVIAIPLSLAKTGVNTPETVFPYSAFRTSSQVFGPVSIAT